MLVFRHPLSLFALFYLSGIILGHYLLPSLIISAPVLITSMVVPLLLERLMPGRFWSMLFLMLAVWALAILRLNQSQVRTPDFSSIGSIALLELEVLEEGRWRAGRWQGRVRCHSRPAQLLAQRPFDIWLTYHPEEMPETWRPGLKVVAEVELDSLPRAASIHHFDFGAYLRRRDVALVGRTEALHHFGQVHGFWHQMALWRKQARQAIMSWPMHYDHRQLLVALLLGDRRGLDQQMIQDFQATGTMHLLAISGMHVGLWFAVLSFCFGLLDRWALGRRLAPWLTIVTLWGYACFTGAAVSVCRATLLATLWTVNRQRGRQVPFWHQLILTGTIFLLWDPRQLFDLGFQLSFLAVTGILAFYPVLPSLWSQGPAWWRAFWNGARLSTAAQLGVFPILIANFHQFPWHFLISNALVLPMMLPNLLGTLILAIIHAVVWCLSMALPEPLFRLLDLWMHLQTGLVRYFASWRAWLWQDLYLEPVQLLALVLLILSSAVFLRQASKAALWLVMLTTLWLSTDLALEARNDRLQRVKIQQTSYPPSAMEINGRQALLMAAPQDTARLLWYFQPLWSAQNVHQWQYVNWTEKPQKKPAP